MKKFKKIRNFSLLLAALLSILTIASLIVINVSAKPIAPNPGNPWPPGTIWGSNLSLENGFYVGQAWYGVGASEQKLPAPPNPPAALIVEFLDNDGNNYFEWVKAAAPESASYSWQVSLRTVGTAAPNGGILRSTMSDISNLYTPNDYSVVLDNQSGNGIFINLRAGAGTITGLKSGAKSATLYVDNAVNIQSIENLDPLTGNYGNQLRLNVYVKNTGRYTDNYSISVGGSLYPTIMNLDPDNTDNIIVTTILPSGTNVPIVVTAAGNYATDQDYITATGDTGSTTQPSIGIHLVAGWNNVAFPVVDNATTPNKIFAPLVYITNYLIYSWNAPSGPYSLQSSDSALLDNTGYWVWIDQGKTVTVVPSPSTIFQDNFNTLNQNTWFANFSTIGEPDWDPSYGTAYSEDSVLYLRPSYFRGTSIIQTRSQIVTELPATVKFSIRFEGDYYRCPHIVLNSVFEEVLGYNNPYVNWVLGTTNHIFYPYGQFIGAYGPDENYVESNRVFEVIPVDEWLEGYIRLYDDRVETSFNGVNLVLYADVKSIVNFAGGLIIHFRQVDDYGQKGLDLDWVMVEAP